MREELRLIVNGRERLLAEMSSPSQLDRVIAALELKPDRIAVEVNGEIAARAGWGDCEVRAGDRLEIVHFVGGGSISG